MTRTGTLDRLTILAGARVPQVKSFGALADVSAVDLSVRATLAALERCGLLPTDIDELIMGNVAGPADATNIARVIGLQAGIPHDRIAHTVNRNCASGMEAIIGGWQVINSGRARRIIVGGTESMSQIPMLMRESAKQKWMAAGRAKTWLARLRAFAQLRPRDFQPILGITLGLTDPSCGLNMGETAEILADEFSVSRVDQDQFAVDSHRKAVAAAQRCFLSGEIVPLDVNGKTISVDIGPRENQSLEQLQKLKPIFRRDGTVTAGNSCPLTDGATSLVVGQAVENATAQHPPLGFVTAHAIAGCDPRRMGLGPVFATSKLLAQTGLQISDFDLIEINEAFAAQVIACLKAFGSRTFANDHLNRSNAIGDIDPEKLNVNGGAIALGHPVGASGTRLVLTLLRALRERKLHRGLATLCVGGGQGFAIIVETE